MENLDVLPPHEKKHVRVNLDIQKEYCPTCRVCEFKCAPGVIKVKKCIEGIIRD